MSNKISVLLVDDHSLVRRGFRRILEDARDITVVVPAPDIFQAPAPAPSPSDQAE